MTWEYVAGFFDGEGNINMPHGLRCKPRVTFYQSGERGLDILYEISAFFAYDVESHLYRISRKNPNSQIMYQLKIYGRDNVRRFLRLIYPYLRVKRIEALDFLRYLKMFPQIEAIHYRRDKKMVGDPTMIERRCKTDEKVLRWL